MGLLKTEKIKDLSGDCSITMIRKKKKHIFDWSFKLEWSVDLKDAGIGLYQTTPPHLAFFHFFILKYIFKLTCKYQSNIVIGPCSGSLTFPDVTPDCEGEYEAQMEVNSTTPPQARAVLNQFVANASQGLRPAIDQKIQQFMQEFNQIE
jgi:hypothetical protein